MASRRAFVFLTVSSADSAMNEGGIEWGSQGDCGVVAVEHVGGAADVVRVPAGELGAAR